MKTTLAIVATVLFMVLAGCGEPDYIQTNESDSADPAAPTKPDIQFPEPDAGQTKKDGGEQTDSGQTDGGTDANTNPPCKIVLYFPDADGDGYGDAMMGIAADCEGRYHFGWATEAGDCRDANPYVYPGAPEVCNNRDDDCNMIVDDKCTTDCAYKADGASAKNQGESECTRANESGACAGHWECVAGQLNCSARVPVAETCDGIDNNCDEQIDETCYVGCEIQRWYRDADGDGYGDPNLYYDWLVCPTDQITLYVMDNSDCDDADPNIHPGAMEICNGKDNNCNGAIDMYDPHVGDDCLTMVGYGDDKHVPTSGVLMCHTVLVTGEVELYCAVACYEQEICDDGRDNNCDGRVDEGCSTSCVNQPDNTPAKNQGVSECSTTDGYETCFGNWVCQNQGLSCNTNRCSAPKPDDGLLYVWLDTASPQGASFPAIATQIMKFGMKASATDPRHIPYVEVAITEFKFEIKDIHNCSNKDTARLVDSDNLNQSAAELVESDKHELVFRGEIHITNYTRRLTLLLDTTDCQGPKNQVIKATLKGLEADAPVNELPVEGRELRFMP